MQVFETRSADDVRLCCRDWRPDGPPRASLLVVHGLGEHVGRYAELGETLARDGIRVLGIDLRGHGMSGGRRGHVRRWSDYGRDLDAAAELLPDDYVVFAHSTGALAALDWWAHGGRPPQRLVLSSPLLGAAVKAPWWKKALARPLAVLLPILPLSNEIRLEHLSTDPDAVELFRRDALRVPTVTPLWYREMNAALDRMRSAALPEVPLQLHLADDELLVDVNAAERLYARWPGDRTRHAWPGRHELLQERFSADLIGIAKDFLLGA